MLAAGLGWVGRTRLDGALTQVAAVDVAPDGVLDAVAQTGDENVLVLATDSGGSAGATTRANTVTVVHRDARGDRTVAVTLPPRLEITRPPCERWDPAAAAYLGQTVPAEPRTTFDSAYAVGGPRCATRAAQQVTGLAITRFVAVDLAATSALVEAVGGVQVCVEQPVLDSVLGPVVATAGTDAFNGARAATLVRAADVRGEPAGGAALVQRQQRVLAAALERALSPTALLHPGRVERPAARAGHRGRVDGHGRRRPARAVERARRGARGADRAAGQQPGQPSRCARPRRRRSSPPCGPTPRCRPRTRPRPPRPRPADVTADVLNASGRDGLAAEVAGTLGDLGFRTAEVRNAGQPALDTVVRFSPDRADQAQLLAAAVPSASAVPDPGTTGVLQLVLGRSFDGTVRASTAPEARRRRPGRTGRDLRLSVGHRSPAVHPPLPLRPSGRNYARPMRDAYQEQLTALGDALADMCLQTAVAMEHATRALLEADLQLAEQVIADDVRIDDLRVAAEEKAFGLLALQAPVATDLRVVISAIHGAGDIERMGDLALHVAQAARRRHPQLVLPDEVAPYFAEMGKIAHRARAQGGRGHPQPRRRDGRARSRPTTTRWTTCTGTCSACSWRRAGATASARRSTSPCSAGSTSATRTTPSRSRAASSTSSPAGCPARWRSDSRPMAPPALPQLLEQLSELLGQMCTEAATNPARCRRRACWTAACGWPRRSSPSDAMGELRAAVEQVATDALLFHAPVAGDLRTVVSAIRVVRATWSGWGCSPGTWRRRRCAGSRGARCPSRCAPPSPR